MRRPTTLTFRRLTRSALLESSAHTVAERLLRSNRRISNCHITLEASGDGGVEPAQYSVRIHLSLPGAQVHADGSPHRGGCHHDVLSALRAAHADALRQLTALHRQPSVSIARALRD